MNYFHKNILSTVTPLLLSTCFLSLGASAVFAQDSDEEMALEEVVVTARKMSENIQDVPVAITAVSADLIDNLGIRGLADISKITAGLSFESEFGRGANRPVIRGQANILGSSGVSYFIDGVYISGSIDDYDINDVERVEVVKGPQSALYGRNTYSGAINIITKSPGREVSGRAAVKVAEDDEYEIAATLRGPMTEHLSGSITGRYYERGGPFTNTWDNSEIGEQESSSVSGVLAYAKDRLDVRFRAYLGRTEDGQPAIFATRTADNNCYFDQGSIYNGRGRYFCGTVEPGPINMDWPLQAPNARQTTNTVQTSLRFDYEINDNVEFTSITGYNERDDTMVTDGDYLPTRFQVSNFTPNGFPYAGFEDGPPFHYGYVGSMIDFTFANASDQKDWSQEFRVSFTGDKMNGLFGAYYYDSEDTTRDIRELPPWGQDDANANYFAELIRMQGVCAANPFCESMAPFFGPTVSVPRNVNSLDIRNIALYGLIAFDIGEAWGLTVEGRYAEEKVKQNAVVQDLGQPIVDTSTASETFKKFTPRVTLDWAINDASMLYLLYAEGTKPGGFNSVVAIEAGLPTFEEEEVQSIELGSKNAFANGQLVANFAAYFNKVDGYQLSQLAQTETQTTTATVNAGDAEIKGFEAELMFRPVAAEGLTLTLNYAYNDSEFVEGVDQNQGVLDDVADNGLVDCSTGDQFPDVDGCTSKFGSIVGHSIPRSPKNQWYFDVDFTRPFGSGAWDWFIGANYFYESNKWSQVHNLAGTGSTTLVNARLGVRNENWLIQLFGRNLTGEDSAPQVLRYAEPYAFTRNFAVSQRRDTYWGIRASYEF
jgi:outer membrane receptor protein involved in Fe transport